MSIYDEKKAELTAKLEAAKEQVKTSEAVAARLRRQAEASGREADEADEAARRIEEKALEIDRELADIAEKEGMLRVHAARLALRRVRAAAKRAGSRRAPLVRALEDARQVIGVLKPVTISDWRHEPLYSTIKIPRRAP